MEPVRVIVLISSFFDTPIDAPNYSEIMDKFVWLRDLIRQGYENTVESRNQRQVTTEQTTEESYKRRKDT